MCHSKPKYHYKYLRLQKTIWIVFSCCQGMWEQCLIFKKESLRMLWSEVLLLNFKHVGEDNNC